MIKEDKNTKYGLGILDLVDPMIDALKESNLRQIGELLNQNWELKKELSSGVTNKEIDHLVNDLNKDKEIYGTKLLGAGGGGYLLVVGEPKRIQSLQTSNVVSFSFENTGSTIIFKDS